MNLTDMQEYLAKLERQAMDMGVMTYRATDDVAEGLSAQEAEALEIERTNKNLKNQLTALRLKAKEMGMSTTEFDDFGFGDLDLPDLSLPTLSSPKDSPTKPASSPASSSSSFPTLSSSPTMSSSPSPRLLINDRYADDMKDLFIEDNIDSMLGELEDPMEHYISQSEDLGETLEKVEDLKSKLEVIQQQARLLGIEM